MLKLVCESMGVLLDVKTLIGCCVICVKYIQTVKLQGQLLTQLSRLKLEGVGLSTGWSE